MTEDVSAFEGNCDLAATAIVEAILGVAKDAFSLDVEVGVWLRPVVGRHDGGRVTDEVNGGIGGGSVTMFAVENDGRRFCCVPMMLKKHKTADSRSA